ncbi:hypothetical protein CSOJ01_04860 [Colletotrichum sojae]|uniref:Uncharacterized protein n=1 Tax=Colletotrichum sojae TaxID=2175907 RepID=A0A8H6JH63_9PEZI|nr:hypothetical protein CSOJ01_04860 [Colletotrichum sojae]
MQEMSPPPGPCHAPALGSCTMMLVVVSVYAGTPNEQQQSTAAPEEIMAFAALDESWLAVGRPREHVPDMQRLR